MLIADKRLAAVLIVAASLLGPATLAAADDSGSSPPASNAPAASPAVSPPAATPPSASPPTSSPPASSPSAPNPPAPSPPAATQTATPAAGEPQAKIVPLARFAPSGRIQQIIKMTIAQPDCTSGGVPVWRLIKPAEHGQISFDTSEQFPDFVVNTPRAQCNDKKLPGIRVSYQSDANYTGMDSAEVLFIYPDGSAVSFRVAIKVI